MILKKISIGLFFLSLLTGCAQNMALLGPAYTLATSGNIYHAGLTYGSNEVITKTTGKSPSENLKEILNPKDDDTELRKLVKERIEKTSIIFKKN
ncbi:hypothetical protein OAC19_00670 [Candidatus Pelagibacter sp.]|nr:hypothetical protein [Candidatus Pelagibacter sp.]